MSQTLSTMFNIKALFMDVDGTAVLSEERNREAIEHVAEQGGHTIRPEDWDYLAGAGDEVIWEKICQKNPDFILSYPTADDFEQACVAAYTARKSELKVNEAVRDIVQHFIGNNVSVAAISNSLSDVVKDNLDITGYDTDLLDFILTKTEIRDLGLQTKPAPDPYLHGLKILNEQRQERGLDTVAVSECLILEDSLTGVRAALKAGMRVIHIRDDSGPLPEAEQERLEKAHDGQYYSCDLNTLPLVCLSLLHGFNYRKNNPEPIHVPQMQPN